MARSSSPIGAFVEDAVEFDDGGVSSVDDLYSAYGAWCGESGYDPGPKGGFIDDLVSFSLAHGHSEVHRSRPGARSEARNRSVTGICLRSAGGQVRSPAE